MKWESVLAWRMRRQHLTARAADPLAVVSDLCGLHAQVLSSAQLTLWARMEDPPDVDELLWRDRSLVKTWASAARCTCTARTSCRCGSARRRPQAPLRDRRRGSSTSSSASEDVKAIIERGPGGAARRARSPATS